MAILQAVDERQVFQAWERQAFDPGVLRDLGFTVVFRGVPSDAGGPDYQEAVLSLDGRSLLSGDVEFHVNSSDWYRHGHHRDRQYNNVILHVVWLDDAGQTLTAEQRAVPTVAIGGSVQTLPRAGGAPLLRPHRCVSRFQALSDARLAGGVRDLGWQRFEERADRFEQEILDLGADQTCYSCLLEACGYASNREAFRRLAEAVPYGWIMCLPSEQRSAALIDAAGLGVAGPIAPPARLPLGVWRLRRLRPGNHPVRRLQAIGALLERFSPSLAEGLSDTVSGAQRPADLRRALLIPDALGIGRADEMAVSAVLPFVAALARSPVGSQRLMLAYSSPPETRWTRVMLDLFQQAGHNLKIRTALQHQGAHLLYTRYCRGEGSPDCPLCQVSGGCRSVL
ncbi:MAG: DUF2851 family protein, partial [Chloroflexota bacterium]